MNFSESFSESFFGVLYFWISFGVTIGPFWVAVMQASREGKLQWLVKNYLAYITTTWVAELFIIGYAVRFMGGFHPYFIISLYFLGSLIMLYYAYKSYRSTVATKSSIQFNYLAMSLLSLTNPKVWLTVPVGFLLANFTGNVFWDAFYFYIIGVPIFLSCFAAYAYLGRKGDQLSKGKMGYFNAILLVLFSGYLLYQGILEIQR